MGLDVVELIVEIESTFDISIPDEKAERIATVGQLVDYVYTRQKPSHKIEKQEVEKHIIHLVSTLIDIPVNEIELHHSFTTDLGMD